MKTRHSPIVLAVLATALILLVACGGGGDDAKTTQPTPEETPTPEPVTITIGNITDLSGIASSGFDTMNISLKDMAQYYTDHRIIPGVSFEVVDYDTVYDPARYVAAYEALKDQGADLFFTSIAEIGTALKARLEQDRMALFTVVPLQEAIDPPGWVFGAGCGNIRSYAYTLLNWISETDPDFPTDRPARIGGALWNEPYAQELLMAAKAYAEAHSDKFEWVYGALPEIKFTWKEEVAALADCDYVIPPILMGRFVAEFATTGHSPTYLGTDAHLAFLGEMEDANLWDEIDRMLFLQSGIWWTDEGEIVDLTKRILTEYHPGQEETVKQMGTGYVTIYNYHVMFEHIASAVEAVGPANFSSQALYDVAPGFSLVANGSSHSYTETKRTSSDELAVYALRAADEDIFKADPRWLPVVYQP